MHSDQKVCITEIHTHHESQGGDKLENGFQSFHLEGHHINKGVEFFKVQNHPKLVVLFWNHKNITNEVIRLMDCLCNHPLLEKFSDLGVNGLGFFLGEGELGMERMVDFRVQINGTT